ncbi:Uncharacterized conserved protein YbbK, DUF523 family [Caldanaerovirga acetigignens]|uniref:Uncharacterized conserved protein YbbK, DUF523 family n=1 Tax=Caldanaerovirga acetigignens TaxID=447595 RepID=A0A1M7G7E4_9FIRM|nr:DUF523 domain-containing protein [Caldanaerovirga acetigignens]SHM12055.1 Uncharacterized conserved protein YbbK, DUF523 family [Caldanaerovirga acetigignens]
MIIISACLAGFNTRYNGENSCNAVFEDLIRIKKAVPFCPEQAGGLPTPRMPAEIIGEDGFAVIKGKAVVLTKDGKNVTEYFIRGAKEMLKLAELIGADTAILKSKSPSCGCRFIYNGKFDGTLKEGMGVTAALLATYGLKVIDSDEYLLYGLYQK